VIDPCAGVNGRVDVLLVDTSVWIEVFRRGTTFRLESIADLEEVVTCLPVVQEVLQGFRDERAFQLARESLYALPIVESPLQRAVFDEAVDLYRRARQVGVTVRSSVDCLIAACALRHGLTVLHRDRDFGDLAKISPLSARTILGG
jgi:predicted nucleic acid-binding protein